MINASASRRSSSTLDERMNEKTETEIITYEGPAVYELIGTGWTIVYLAIASILVGAFLLGVAKRIKNQDNKKLLWFIGTLSVLTMVHGLSRYAEGKYRLYNIQYAPEGNVGMSNSLYSYFQMEIYASLGFPALVATLGLLLYLLLGLLRVQPVDCGQ